MKDSVRSVATKPSSSCQGPTLSACRSWKRSQSLLCLLQQHYSPVSLSLFWASRQELKKKKTSASSRVQACRRTAPCTLNSTCLSPGDQILADSVVYLCVAGSRVRHHGRELPNNATVSHIGFRSGHILGTAIITQQVEDHDCCACKRCLLTETCFYPGSLGGWCSL